MKGYLAAGLILLLSASICAEEMTSRLTARQEEDFRKIHQSLNPGQRELLSRAVEQFAGRYGTMAGQVDPESLLGEVTAGMAGGGVNIPEARFCVMVGAIHGLQSDLELLNREMAILETVRGQLSDQVDRLGEMAGAKGNGRNPGARPPAEPPPGLRGALSKTGPDVFAVPEATRFTPAFRIPFHKVPPVSPLPETAGMNPVRIKALLHGKAQQLERVNRSAQNLQAAIQDATLKMSHLVQAMSDSPPGAHDMEQQKAGQSQADR